MALIAVGLTALTGCGGTTELDNLVTSIAHSQGVEESAVRSALEVQTNSSDEELKLARSLDQDLPKRQLPDLSAAWENLAEKAKEELKSATCEAVLDVIGGQPVPNGQEFLAKYLNGVAGSVVPGSEVSKLMADFDDLQGSAQQGTLTTTDIRLLMLKPRSTDELGGVSAS